MSLSHETAANKYYWKRHEIEKGKEIRDLKDMAFLT